MTLLISFLLTACVFLALGIALGYMSWRITKLYERIVRIETVLAHAGPEIVRRLEETETKVMVSAGLESWDSES